MLYQSVAISFLLVFSLVICAYQLAGRSQFKIKSRLSTIRDTPVGDADDEPLSLPFRVRIIKPVEEKIIKFCYGLLPPNLLASIERKLTQCGNPRGLKARSFVGGVIFLTFVVTLVGIFIPLALGLGLKKAVLTGFCALLFSVIVPALWLYAVADNRVKEVDRSLPDVVDLLVVCVEAGLGLDMALSKVTEKMKGPLPDEIGRALSEMQIGKTRQAALKDLSERVGSHNLSSFLAMVIQGGEMGVTMGRILRVQSETMRRVRRQKAEEQAMKAPVKIVFPLVFFILPALFVVILGPAVIRILKSGLMG